MTNKSEEADLFTEKSKVARPVWYHSLCLKCCETLRQDNRLLIKWPEYERLRGMEYKLTEFINDLEKGVNNQNPIWRPLASKAPDITVYGRQLLEVLKGIINDEPVK